jgi:hypothetical protein
VTDIKPPRKRWRVRDRDEASEPVTAGSEKAAFQEVARAINGKGHEAWVYHFEGGRWQLYEKLPANTIWHVPEPVTTKEA